MFGGMYILVIFLYFFGIFMFVFRYFLSLGLVICKFVKDKYYIYRSNNKLNRVDCDL